MPVDKGAIGATQVVQRVILQLGVAPRDRGVVERHVGAGIAANQQPGFPAQGQLPYGQWSREGVRRHADPVHQPYRVALGISQANDVSLLQQVRRLDARPPDKGAVGAAQVGQAKPTSDLVQAGVVA